MEERLCSRICARQAAPSEGHEEIVPVFLNSGAQASPQQASTAEINSLKDDEYSLGSTLTGSSSLTL